MRKEIEFGREKLIVETGKIAKQANGSVTVQYGGTVVLVSACISTDVKEGKDFFPLFVEYQEKTYAAGKIPGGFFKREGRPTENVILTSRLVDRSIRPLFPKNQLNEVQVMAIVLSSDGQNDPDILSIIGASLALSISNIPFAGPVSAAKVARLDGEFILNPTYEEIANSDLEVLVSLTKDGVIMLESKAKEVSEDVFIKAVEFACEKLKGIMQFQEEFAKEQNVPKLENLVFSNVDEALLKKVKETSLDRLNKALQINNRDERKLELMAISKELEEKFVSEECSVQSVKQALASVEKECIRALILKEGKRIDGRSPTDIRPISCEVGVLPRTHGSALFTRGQTQSLAVTTLGTGDDQQFIEALEGETHKTFMLHYNFPPFSVGEVSPVRGPGRREIGHGALAEKALLAIVPDQESFPYTVRIVSEILESNGSSSMATVCASTLSLMDAGVPVKRAVAGLALGLVKDNAQAVVLTDIAGLEDHLGDMDFKVAGTEDGITTVQLDLKIQGINIDLLTRCLNQSKEGRLSILSKMKEALPESRAQLSEYAPRIEILKINPEKIGGLIGPGGKTVKKIISDTGVSIDIQDTGDVLVASTDSEKSQKAIDMIRAITDDIEVGRIYNAKVKRIVPFGAFCEIAPNKDGLVHVSELADHFVKTVEDVVKIGDEFQVKVIGIDEMGRINLSKKKVDSEASDSKKD